MTRSDRPAEARGDHARHRGSWRVELAVAVLGVLVGLTMAAFVLS